MRKPLHGRIRSLFVALGLVILVTVPKAALAEGDLPVPVQKTQITSVRRNIATVMFFGIGGAVLGLSTLSFYPNPSQNLGNITTGLAIGLIGGIAYVTADAWSNPSANHSQAGDPYREFQSRDTTAKPAMAQFRFDF